MKNSLVSIAMATFNGQAFIAEQMDSLLAQSYTNLEIVVIEDCSTDDTRSILQAYASKDDRVKLFFNEENIGYKAAFYKAVKQCQGEYICFCDQDDSWFENKIETLLDHIEDNLLIFSDSELVNEKGQPINVKLSDTVNMLQPGTDRINRGFVIGNCVWGHTILFHHNLLAYALLENNPHPHDWWFAVVSSHLKKIKYYPGVLNQYRQHAHNLTQAIPVKANKAPSKKIAEFEMQLSRVSTIAALPFNTDRAFYQQWHALALQKKQGFSWAFFKFLLAHRQDVFSLKKKNGLSQLIEIRKMCRRVE